MDGMTARMSELTDAQAAAWELTVNRIFAAVIFIGIAVLVVIWIKSLHLERMAYAEERIEKRTAQKQKELDNWHCYYVEQKREMNELNAKIKYLERENSEMKALMSRVKLGDLVAANNNPSVQ